MSLAMQVARNIPVPFTVGFVATLIFFFVVFDYFGIELTNWLILAILGFGLMHGAIVTASRRGIFHEGHMSILFGAIFLIIGSVLVYGTLTFDYFDEDGNKHTKEQLWDLTEQETGVFILLAIIGIWSIVGGIKQMMGYSYLWGIKRGH